MRLRRDNEIFVPQAHLHVRLRLVRAGRVPHWIWRPGSGWERSQVMNSEFCGFWCFTGNALTFLFFGVMSSVYYSPPNGGFWGEFPPKSWRSQAFPPNRYPQIFSRPYSGSLTLKVFETQMALRVRGNGKGARKRPNILAGRLSAPHRV